jgi:hypothetical protein
MDNLDYPRCAVCRVLFVVMLSVVMLSFIVLSVVMLSAIMLSVIMLSVVAPFKKYIPDQLNVPLTLPDDLL